MDIDLLVQHEDFAEARQMAQRAKRSAANLNRLLARSAKRYGSRADPRLHNAEEASAQADAETGKILALLDELFPRADEVLTPEQLAQMENMEQKQRELDQQAGEVEAKMQALSREVPLFGEDTKRMLRSARGEMQQAHKAMGEGKLPGASGHKRLAVEHLGKLRQALEKASKGNQGGLPLPLGGNSGQGGQGRSRGFRQEDVEIPQSDPGSGGPGFREELLEAAKQKAPQRYEEAVRKYYEELIR
jgi:hypothetical protein